MSDLGYMSLGVKLGIALGCLIGITICAGLIKLYISKRRAETKRQEEAARPADKEKLVPKEANEGNLFGVRAIENGYFGGVSQTSRPASPTSSYRLAPDTPIVDWGKGGKGLNSSASSINSYAASTNLGKMKSSPLRLEAGEAAGVGGIGGTYLPPAPSPRSNRAESPMFGEPKPAGWVNPLDVHYSRPTTPQPNRPTSYLPKLDLDFGGSGLLMPTSSEVKSEAASIVSSEVAVATPSPAVLKSPTTGVFSSHLSNVRAAQQSLKSMFPAANEQGLPSPKGGRFEDPPVPLKDLSPTFTSVDPDKFPQDNRRWNPSSPAIRDSVLESRWNKPSPPVDSTPLSPTVRDSVLNEQWGLSAISSIPSTPTTLNASSSPRFAGLRSPPPPSPTVPDSVLDAEWDRSRPIIRDSVVSKQRVSVHRPIRQRDSRVESLLAREQSKDHLRRSHLSIAASSMYSNDSSILNIDEATSPKLPMHARMQSHQADFDFSHPHSPSQSTSTRAKSITRTRDSSETTRHRRSVSDESLIQVGRHDRELQSDSESKTNLHPRESPFSNSNAASSHSDLHSTTSSFSSYLSSRSASGPGQEAPSLPTLVTKAQPTPPVDFDNFPFPAAPAPRPAQGQGFPFREQQIGAPPRSAARPPPPSPRGLGFEMAIPPARISPDSNNHLSITPGNRGRSTSEVSQNSIGEFYDSYFRQSTMAGGMPKAVFGVGNRGSVQDRISGINNRESSGSVGMGMRDRDSRRPAPLNLNQKKQQETINETPTPRTGAFGGAPMERFPTRI